MDSQILIIIIVICIALILIGIARHNYRILVNFILRVVIGAVCIIGLNFLLSLFHFSLGVAINGTTLLISGVLGVPGVALLYALATYFHFR